MIDLDRLRRNEPSYLEEVVREYGPVVMMVVRRFGDDQDEVEDLFQRVWVHLLNGLSSYAGRGPFGAWVHRVALNVCRGEARKRSTRSRGRERMTNDGALQELSWMPPDPLRRLEREEKITRLREALPRLPTKQREAIQLRYLDDRPVREVAQILGVEEATVRSYVSKGIKNLRSSFERQSDELSGR